MTQPRMECALLPIPRTWGTCYTGGVLLWGGRNAARDSTEFCLRRRTWKPRVRRGLSRNHGFSRVVWLWFYSRYPGQMICKALYPMTTIPTTRILIALGFLVLFAGLYSIRWQFQRYEQNPATSGNRVVATVGTRSITLREVEQSCGPSPLPSRPTAQPTAAPSAPAKIEEDPAGDGSIPKGCQRLAAPGGGFTIGIRRPAREPPGSG